MITIIIYLLASIGGIFLLFCIYMAWDSSRENNRVIKQGEFSELERYTNHLGYKIEELEGYLGVEYSNEQKVINNIGYRKINKGRKLTKQKNAKRKTKNRCSKKSNT